MKALIALFEGMRPRQWTKNVLVLLGVVFAQKANDPYLLWKSFEAFLVFCILSGTVYLFNDRLDMEQDRLHPVKKNRPLASGRLPEGLFRVGFVVLLLGGLAWSWMLGRNFFYIAAVFLLLNLLYSLWLKHQVILDVFGIAMNFVLRAVAGVAVLAENLVTGFEQPGANGGGQVFLSPWLLVTTFFGALFLAFAKRRSELVAHGHARKTRKVLAFYSPRLLDQLLSLSAGVVLLAYALYTLWPSTVERLGQDIIITTVFVTYGVMRYFYLVYREDRGEDPSEVLLSDRPLIVGVLLWIVTVILCVGY